MAETEDVPKGEGEATGKDRPISRGGGNKKKKDDKEEGEEGYEYDEDEDDTWLYYSKKHLKTRDILDAGWV